MAKPELTEEEVIKLKRILENFVELRPDEVVAMRSIVEADRRAKWLWAAIRNFAVWIVAVGAGISFAYGTLIDTVKHLAGK